MRRLRRRCDGGDGGCGAPSPPCSSSPSPFSSLLFARGGAAAAAVVVALVVGVGVSLRPPPRPRFPAAACLPPPLVSRGAVAAVAAMEVPVPLVRPLCPPSRFPTAARLPSPLFFKGAVAALVAAAVASAEVPVVMAIPIGPLLVLAIPFSPVNGPSSLLVPHMEYSTGDTICKNFIEYVRQHNCAEKHPLTVIPPRGCGTASTTMDHIRLIIEHNEHHPCYFCTSIPISPPALCMTRCMARHSKMMHCNATMHSVPTTHPLLVRKLSTTWPTWSRGYVEIKNQAFFTENILSCWESNPRRPFSEVDDLPTKL